MADEIKKDTVDYRDPTPFDDTKLNSISEISKGIRHKYFGKDTREALAQQGEALVKLMQETGGNPNAEVIAARGNYGTLGMREIAQENAIRDSFSKTEADKYLKSITVVPETFANLAAIKSKYPSGKNGLMVAADNGHKYIWANNVWTDAGVYQAVGIPDNSIGSSQISEVNSNSVYDTFLPLNSAKMWKSTGALEKNGRDLRFDCAADNGVILQANLDRDLGVNEYVYLNGSFSSDSTKANLNIYFMKPNDELAGGNMIVKGDQSFSLPISAEALTSKNLGKNFKLLFIGEGTGHINLTNVTLNFSNRIDNSVVMRNIKTTTTSMAQYMRWNASIDDLSVEYDENENEITYVQMSDGNVGIDIPTRIDVTKAVYLTFSLSSNANVSIYVRGYGPVVGGSKTQTIVANERMTQYRFVINQDRLNRISTPNQVTVLFSTSMAGSWFRLANLNCSNTDGFDGQGLNNNNIFSNIGIQDKQRIGHFSHNQNSQSINQIKDVGYCTYDVPTSLTGRISELQVFVKSAGTYKFAIGGIDQNKLIVDRTDFTLNLVAGNNLITKDQIPFEIKEGQYLFMDLSEIGGMFVREEYDHATPNSLIQDEAHQSDVPGYTGMIMLESNDVPPFCYTVESYSITDNIKNLKESVGVIKDGMQDVYKSGDDLFISSKSGKKFQLVVSDDGTITAVAHIPDKVAIFGNSLTTVANKGNIGMAASDQYHDWYYLVTSRIKELNPSITVNDRTNIAAWETATTSETRQTIYESSIKPVLTSDTNLVILQLLDNVNTDEQRLTFAEDSKKLLTSIHADAPNARVCWVASWGNTALIPRVQAACDATNSILIDISDISARSDVRSEIGAIRTGTDGASWQIDNAGEASHPADLGMKLIAQRILNDLNLN